MILSLIHISVIDQNYEVLKDIVENNINKEISSEDLMKFHSVVPIEYENFEGYDARFCFENWQSKIISTTFVQLLNTIFKIGKNSIVNRFHRLANSVIILDEVQAIDEKYYKIISEFINIMVRQYNCYIILVTATMPMLLDTIDLIEDKEKYFRKLNRIEIINNSESEITLDEFEDIVLEDICENKDKSFLVVLNTVKSSKNIYKYLKENTDRDIMYLSTEIYPKLRLEKINKIKNSYKKYVVVSTQLIEAGVDIDMDIVYRDFSTLDSINQTAGRANRNGVGGKGIVKLYKIVDNDRTVSYTHLDVYKRQVLSWNIIKSTRYKRMFYILSILVLILNASIPVINQIEKFPIVVTIVASISTVITGIITLINFKDVWYRYRVTAEKIKTECMLLNCRLGQYSCVNREKKFLIRIEEILAEDQESWIKSRFTDNEEDEEDK